MDKMDIEAGGTLIAPFVKAKMVYRSYPGPNFLETICARAPKLWVVSKRIVLLELSGRKTRMISCPPRGLNLETGPGAPNMLGFEDVDVGASAVEGAVEGPPKGEAEGDAEGPGLGVPNGELENVLCPGVEEEDEAEFVDSGAELRGEMGLKVGVP